MANEFIIKNGFVSKGNSTIEGTFSGSTLKTNTIDTSLRNLYASDLTPTVDWETTQLVGVGGSVILDWTQGTIKDSGPNLSIDWNNRILYDGSEIGVLDWQNKIMTGMTNVTTTVLTVDETIDFSSAGTISGAGLVIPTTIPAEPVSGSTYVDLSALRLYIYDGVTWRNTILT